MTNPQFKVKMPVGDSDEPTYIKSKTDDDTTPNLDDNKDKDVDDKDKDDKDEDKNIDDRDTDNDTNLDDNKDDKDTDDKSDSINFDELDTVVIDEEELYINSDGNIINKEGKQIYSSDEFTQMKLNSSDIDVNLLSQKTNLTLYDEQGKPVEFENTLDGLAKRELLLTEQIQNETRKQTLLDFFKSYPTIKDVFEHYKQTGTLDNFKPVTSYKEVKLAETDDESKLANIILEAEVKKGNSPEKAYKYIEFYKANNELYKEAVEAKEYLVKAQEIELSNKQKAQQDKERETRQKYVEFLGYDIDKDGKEIILNKEGSVYDKIVQKGQIGMFKIPESGITIKKPDGSNRVLKRKDIFNYIALAVDDEGRSQAELDEMQYLSSLDNRLMRFLNNLTGNDLSKLIPQSIADKKVKEIKRYSATGVKRTYSSSPKKITNIKTPVD